MQNHLVHPYKARNCLVFQNFRNFFKNHLIVIFSDQTDARAERILHICRKVALDKEFGSLLNIEFGNPMNGGTFISPVMIQNTIGQNDQKVTRGPPVIDSKLIPPFDPHTGNYSKCNSVPSKVRF